MFREGNRGGKLSDFPVYPGIPSSQNQHTLRYNSIAQAQKMINPQIVKRTREKDMTQSIVECIANYSEARRPEVIEAIMRVIAGVTDVHVLDRHSDMDHNRTVITFAGPPGAIEEAAFRSIVKASELINLDEHTGAHPRIGATDVVPFVPISGVTMAECVEIARKLGKRVGEELGIAVYLYEEAATRPERQNLENIRRGQYETLKKEIASNPDRQPDFGPSWVGPAGATVIGARRPLIAFNVYLTTDDVSIATKIAKALRHSSGGLRYVKAMGVLVDGRAQVSMNLTNYHATPPARVVEMIRREATRYGVSIHHSELVGLIPQEAMVEAAIWYMQLDQFEPHQVLETRLYPAMQESQKNKLPNEEVSFLDALAAGTPTPGGGAAAAYCGATAAALAEMVARLSTGKKKYADIENQMQTVLAQAELLRNSLNQAVQRDSDSFDAVIRAYRQPKEPAGQAEQRIQAIEEATLGAIQVPLEVAHYSVQVLELAVQVAKLGNLNAICDSSTAAALARAALTGAGLNVRINIDSLQDPSAASDALEQIKALEQQADDLDRQVRVAFTERTGIEF